MVHWLQVAAKDSLEPVWTGSSPLLKASLDHCFRNPTKRGLQLPASMHGFQLPPWRLRNSGNWSPCILKAVKFQKNSGLQGALISSLMELLSEDHRQMSPGRVLLVFFFVARPFELMAWVFFILVHLLLTSCLMSFERKS